VWDYEVGLKQEDTTPLGLIIQWGHFPRVARHAQPWAMGRNPVGILKSEDGTGLIEDQFAPSFLWAIEVGRPEMSGGGIT
jgi:hypothetical protein